MCRKELMASLLASQRISAESCRRYSSSPREYGQGHWMYMYEAHLIEAVGTEDIGFAELLAKLELTKSVLIQRLNRLELKGYLVRTQADGFDKAHELICLTALGRDVYKGHKDFDKQSHAYISEAFDKYSDEQLEQFIEYEKLVQNIFSHKV